jgi:hypothetical protein
MAIVKISDLPLVDQPVEGTDLFVVVQDNVTKKAYASNIQTYVGFEEIQYATAGQTVFNLTTMSYAPGGNNLMVFVDGVNQYEGLSYTETNSTRVTFSQGLHQGAVVKFSTVQTQTSSVASAGAVTFLQAGTGAVARSVQSKLRDTVSVKDFGAVGDGVTDDLAAIQAAINFVVSQNGGTVYFPSTSTSYVCSGAITIPDLSTDITLLGEKKYVTLKFTSTTANGINIVGQSDNLCIQNLHLYAVNNSSGTAISSIGTTSSLCLRDFEFIDVNITYFTNGIILYGLLNGLICGGRQTGVGKATYGIGLQIGEDINRAGNSIVVQQMYIANYAIGVMNKYCTPAYFYGTIIYGANIALNCLNTTQTYFYSGYIENNDEAISNAAGAYLNWNSQISSTGTQTVNVYGRRFYRRGFNEARVVAFRSAVSGTQVIPTGAYTKLVFNDTQENSENLWNTTTRTFTAGWTGYYYVSLSVLWRSYTANSGYRAAIYKNGSLLSYGQAIGTQSTASIKEVTAETSKLVWLAKGDTIEAYAYHDEGIDSEVYPASEKSYISIVSV